MIGHLVEESAEFLPSVDRGAPLPPGRRGEVREVISQLLPPLTGPHLTYTKLPWRLAIRKEVSIITIIIIIIIIYCHHIQSKIMSASLVAIWVCY